MRALGKVPGGPARPRIHGGPLDEDLHQLAMDPAKILDFSVNTNPYGPCPAVVDAVRNAPIERYPDPTARAVRQALASQLEVRPDQVVLGNGAADLLWTLARVLVHQGSTAVIVEPTFGEFRAAVEAMGGRAVEWRARAEDQFVIDLRALSKLIRECEPDVVYLCAPNTPTAVSVPAVGVASLAQENAQVAVLVDQSFLSLSESFEDEAARFPDNVVGIRSLTKEHAIPGVRVGYVIAAPDVAARVEECRPAWTTNAAAQAAALAALGQTHFVCESRRKLLADRARLAHQLGRLNLHPFPSTTSFFMLPVQNASELRRRLLSQHGILVRDCASFGLPDFVRLCGRPEPDCERLFSALQEELSRC